MEEYCPLSDSTARLSISHQDRPELKDLMENVTGERRGSAVSFESFSNDEAKDKSSGSTYEQSPLQQVESRSHARRRRRRSSALSKETAPPPKVHKRKLKKMMEQPNIELAPGTVNLSMYDFADVAVEVFGELPGNLKPKITVSATQEIPKVVICFVGGLTRGMFIDNTISNQPNPVDLKADVVDTFPFISSNFLSAVTFKSPGDKKSLFSPLDALTYYKLTKKEKKKLLTDLQTTKITIDNLRMLLQDLRSNNYPIHSSLDESQKISEEQGWVETKSFEHEGSHIFALDCEFCNSDTKKVLTRISVVDFNGDVKMDTYVKPSSPITDYLTKYSGITEECLDGVTTTLEDVQNQIIELISLEDYLIGHSLESDLNVMKVKHPKIVDTSICFHHIRGPPSKPGLRWLTSKHLARDIQLGEESGKGHSSVEDARACLDLVKLKIMEGALFGLNCLEVFTVDKINDIRKSHDLEPISGMLIDYRCETKETDGFSFISVNNDDEVVDNFTRHIDEKDFAIVNFRELEASKGWTSVCNRETDVSTSYRNLNNRLNTVYSLLPENSIFIVLSIHGSDTTEVNQLRKLRRDATEDNMLDLTIRLQNQIETARESIGFINIKQ